MRFFRAAIFSLTLILSTVSHGQSFSSFSAPDTVCINRPFSVTNTSTGANTYNWNFCATSLSNSPSGVNLGNPGSLGLPVFMDYILENGNWYGLMVNNTPGGLVRLNFGNSLLNVPTSTYLGDFGGVIANSSQGVQIANHNGNVIAIIVGGDPVFGVSSRVIKMDFGNSITNTPTCTNWGNPGGLMNYPNDMYLFKEANIWYALTINYFTDAITRLNFGTDFSAPPTAVNLPVNIDGSAGFFPLYDNGNWYVFAVNYDGNSLSRILFGSSLTNNPISSVNLGNINGLLNKPRDIQLFNFCGQKFGFMTNGTTNQLLRLDFTSFTSIPTATQLGNVGNMSGPQSFSKTFRVGADIYSFVPNTQSNTITRLNFLNVCNTVNNPFSSLHTPPQISYSSPGKYTIMLNTDEGLSTYSTFCKEVVAIAPPSHSATQQVQMCNSIPVKIGSAIKNGTYLWNTGATSDSIVVTTPGIYWVESTRFGCMVRDSFNVSCIRASFTSADTVCVNSPLTFTNTSTGTSSYNWNFCTTSINSTPSGVNLGNPGSLGLPVFIDYIQEGGNWYGLLVNNTPGGLVRLNFGNSLLNTPTSTYLGNFGGIIANSSQGVQIANHNGNIIAIIVGGDPVFGVSSRVIKMDFGSSITNTPVATNWGNPGGLMNYPNDLHLFKEGDTWMALTVNYFTDAITRLNFGTNFSSVPTAVNLPVNIDGSAGFLPFYDSGNWYVFVANYDGNSLSRVDFGSSLANMPSNSVNLGNIGGLLNRPRDIQLFNFCGTKFGFLTNGNLNQLLRLDFSSFTGTPTATQLGNVGNMSGPQSFSKPFRVGSDIYSFVPNTQSNTITRLNFLNACPVATAQHSTATNPAPVSYSAPGTYTVMLTADEGLTTYSTACKQVVVIAAPTKSPTQNLQSCFTTPLKLGSPVTQATYLWSTGATSDSINVVAPGTYWVESNRFGCSIRDSFVVTVGGSIPKPDFGYEQNLCNPVSITFSTTLSNVQSYEWDFGNGQKNTSSLNPTVVYGSFGNYQVKLKIINPAGCSDSTIKLISVNALQNNSLITTVDTTICNGSSVPIRVSATGISNCLRFSGNTAVLNRDTLVTPNTTTTYHFTVLNNGSNLVTNGDFSSGNTGFTTQYDFANNNSTEGQFNVAVNPQTWNSSLSGCRDHTTGGGNMMMVNGSPEAGKVVWSQTIAVTPNTTYSFSTWIQSLFSVNPANLRFSINNTVIGNNITASSSTCNWQRFFTTWNSGNSTTAVISIVNNNTIVMGNDFAIDDIYFGGTVMQTDSVKITVLPRPTMTIFNNDSTICSGTSVSLNSASSGTSITWTPATSLSDPNIANPVSTPSSTVKYYAEANAGSGCSTKDSVTITVLKMPTAASIADTAICAGSSIVLQTAISDATSIQWTPASTLSNPTIANPTATPATFTEYIVTATNGGICTAKDSVKVNVKPVPIVTVTDDTTVCGTANIQLVATGGTSYSWSPGTGLSSTTAANPVAQPTSTTKYKVTVTGANGCQKQDSVTITVNPLPVFGITPSTQAVCAGSPITITASGGDVYSWTPAPGITNPVQPAITLTPAASGNYTVNVSHTACKTSQTLTAAVQVNPLPDVSVTKSNDVNCSSPNSQLLAAGGATYLWTPATGLSNPAIANPIASPTVNTIYTVKVGSPEGCYAEKSILVNFTGGSSTTLYIPNAFTPNNDGLNDEFKVFFPGVQKFSMMIFNGWGEMIFKTTDINKGWNGFYKGQKQGTDVYVYIVNAEGFCGPVFRKGTFMLIR